MRADFTLTGDKALARQFAALETGVRGRMALRALVSGALPIANDAKGRAAYDTGNLRRSIHVGGEGTDGTTTGSDVGGQTIGRDFVEVLVGTNVAYAARIEFGFAGPDALGRVYHQAARPYLRPAIEGQRGAVEAEIAAAMRDLIRAAVR
jgi:HK97 gp10 family phage protein